MIVRRLVVLLCLFLSIKSIACDVCGGATRFGFNGVLPLTQQHFISGSFQNQRFFHPSSSVSSRGFGQVLYDRLSSYNVRLQYAIKNRWQLNIAVPYKLHQRIEEGRTTTLRGVGDVVLGPSYQILSRSADSLKVKQFLRVEGQLGLPTGKYMQRDNSLSMLPALFQLGSGAWQYGLNLRYSMLIGNFGFNVVTNISTFSKNELGYQLGSRYSLDVPIFYVWTLNKIQLIPQVGISMERLNKDEQFGLEITHTGASRVLGQLGLSVQRKAWMFSLSAREVLSQEIPLTQPKATKLWAFSVLYNFGG